MKLQELGTANEVMNDYRKIHHMITEIKMLTYRGEERMKRNSTINTSHECNEINIGGTSMDKTGK